MKKQLEARWKSIQAQMQNQGGFEQDDAAGIRKYDLLTVQLLELISLSPDIVYNQINTL